MTAYLGAAPAVTDKGVLAAAGAILGVEAYHAGIIRTLLFQDGALPVKPYAIQTVDFVQVCSMLLLPRLHPSSAAPGRHRNGMPALLVVIFNRRVYRAPCPDG